VASCSFVKHGLSLLIFGRQHQHTFKHYVHVQLSLSLHFCLLRLLLNNCDENEAKQCVFLRRLLVTLKKAGFILAYIQIDVLSASCMQINAFSVDQQLR